MGENGTKVSEQTETEPPLNKSFFSVNKNLITLKITLFFLYGATSSLLPYLTVHMQSIGLTIEEIALVYLALPFTTFLAPPVTGFLVDKFGRYKPVILISFVLNAVIHHSLLFLPHQEVPGEVPSAYVLRHPELQVVEVWWSPCPSRECPVNEELDVVLDMCVDHCVFNKTVNRKTQEETSPNQIDVGDKDDLIFHIGKKNRSTLALQGHNKKKKKNGRKTKKIFENETAVMFSLEMHPALADPTENFGIELELDEEDESITFKSRFNEEFLINRGVNYTELEDKDLRCGGIVMKTNATYEKRLMEYSGDCIVQKCNFRFGGPHVCPPDYREANDKIFWIYFFLRFLASIMLSAGITIMDPVALTMIEKYGGDFGREKLFSSLGMALFSPITGALIDYNSRRLGYTDYSAAFYTYDVLLFIAGITVLIMPLGTKLPADNLFRDLFNIFKMPHIIIFIIFLYILGNFWGFIESFLFFYLKDLGAPNYLLGITVTVGTVSSMPFLYGAERITSKIGHVNVIIIAFFAHAARLMGYSFIESAWWCFPFEALESVSVHLMWVAAATYCAIITPKNLLATLIGVVGMAHYSIGRGSGSFVGGQIISKIGIRQAFRLMGAIAVGTGISYGLIHCLWLKKVVKKFDGEVEEDIEGAETEKLKPGEEPKFKDQSTMVSMERLSLMVEFNQIGSLTSLGRHAVNSLSRGDIRRGSYTVGMFNKASRGSASKVDLLKSAIEVNSRGTSNQNLKRSVSGISKHGSTKIADNAGTPTLNKKSVSLSPVVDKVIEQNLIPDETEEIIYATSKSKNNDEDPEKVPEISEENKKNGTG
ncbi:uncharacterized protein LOC108735277 [Agrilus planipennis]|uniref:Uncharacterized protein LOC108735277 n=1 Tax=Agrilus planipennis TaxID=224129 RepID=A0A1W4WRC4_AGRPL|nr:uncharacterized protein LOC108735277 [Agrilus planipennis]